jgi:hypothetical protein
LPVFLMLSNSSVTSARGILRVIESVSLALQAWEEWYQPFFQVVVIFQADLSSPVSDFPSGDIASTYLLRLRQSILAAPEIVQADRNWGQSLNTMYARALTFLHRRSKVRLPSMGRLRRHPQMRRLHEHGDCLRGALCLKFHRS